MKLTQTFKELLLKYTSEILPVFLVAVFSATALTGQAPSSILPDIVNFKVEYPLDDNGDDYTGIAWGDRDDPHIKNEVEENLSGYVAPLPYQDYFYVDGNEVVFKAHCAGALTSINAYPRCELREQPGGTNSFWNFADEQELNATFRVTHLPDLKQEVSILQIKGNTSQSTSNTSETLRLEYRANSGQALHLTINETTTLNDIMDYSLGQTIEARLYINNGDVTVELTNTSTGDTYFNQFASAYAFGYFKAGCYTQSSIWEEKNGVGDELPTAYGEVRFSKLELGISDVCIAVLPANRAATNVTTTSVRLNWEYDSNMDHYNVRYRPLGSATWEFFTSLRLNEGDFTVSGSTVIFDIIGLTEDTNYEWQVRAKCADGSATSYSEGAGPNFMTLLTVLPVELINFNGAFEERNNRIALIWRTASETNNKGFKIERSLDPRNGFEEIGWIDGKGNSNILNEYSFNDKIIEMGKRYYYRLRQMDLDGRSELSKTITIQTAKLDNDWTVFPNPVLDIITILSRGDLQITPTQGVEGLIQIINTNGSIVFEQARLLQKEEEIKLNISYLPSGVYSLLISDDKGQILTVKSVVRK